MKAVVIEKVEIKAFKNIANKTYTIDGNSISFSGNNRLGKTNSLHAISWCLTGYDLNDNKDLMSFVPFADRETNKKSAVDVIVQTNVCTIERIIDKTENSCSQRLLIDGCECKTAKEGDALIDSALGLLDFTIKNRDVDIRRFLLNPMYINFAEKSKIRSFVISLLNVDLFETLNKMPNIVLEKISDPLIKAGYSISKVSKQIKSELKENTENKKVAEIVLNYLNANHPELVDDLSALNKKIEDANSNVSLITEESIALDKFSTALSKEYDSACRDLFSGIKFRLFEKGLGDDVWFDVCYPLTPTGLPLETGSTSERIILGCKFINAVCSICNLPAMPILFDEAETLDSISLTELKNKVATQLLSAKVNNGAEILTEVL